LSEIGKGSFTFKRALEDIHMNVESRLGELIGPAAGRLHTARSRNDQVATDFRLYVRDVIDDIDRALAAFQRALVARAIEHADTVMPGFTHLQTAQPVTFGHHLLAYTEMASRDRGRFADARKRLNESPLGAAALAGTSFPIDRHATARALGFDRPMANSLDAVSDRDFVLETLSASAIAAVHLSRFAEEIVIWTSPLVGLVRLSDKFTTGSSIMPQKRNPDAAELVRAKTGRVIGSLNALLIVMKGLPLAYQKDMQEDKEGAMEALPRSLAIRAMTGMTLDLVPEEARMKWRQARVMRPRPILPTGWCARSRCRSAMRITSPGGSLRRRRSRASPCTRYRSATCRPSSRKSPKACSTCCRCRRRWKAAPVTAAPPRRMSARRPKNGSSGWKKSKIRAEPGYFHPIRPSPERHLLCMVARNFRDTGHSA
jgi:hypothetical protein